MTREEAKEKAQSRDCSCVNGKDRDSNFNSVIDEVFDWHEKDCFSSKKVLDFINLKLLTLKESNIKLIHDINTAKALGFNTEVDKIFSDREWNKEIIDLLNEVKINLKPSKK